MVPRWEMMTLMMTCITATEFFNTTDYADYRRRTFRLSSIRRPSHESMEKDSYIKILDGEAGDLQYDIYDLLEINLARC